MTETNPGGVDPTEPCACAGCATTISINGAPPISVSATGSTGGVGLSMPFFNLNGDLEVGSFHLSFSFMGGTCDEAANCAPATPCKVGLMRVTLAAGAVPIDWRFIVSKGGLGAPTITKHTDPAVQPPHPFYLPVIQESDTTPHFGEIPCGGTNGYSIRVEAQFHDAAAERDVMLSKTIQIGCSDCVSAT
jgi:hypothetical protein